MSIVLGTHRRITGFVGEAQPRLLVGWEERYFLIREDGKNILGRALNWSILLNGSLLVAFADEKVVRRQGIFGAIFCMWS